MFNSIRSKKILQTMVDYEEYKALSKKNILPMLISISEEQKQDADCIAILEQLYLKSFLTHTIFPDGEKELYTIEPEKLTKNRIPVGHFIHQDGKVSKILNVSFGSDTFLDSGGFYLKTGYQNLDDLSHEVVDPFLAQKTR